MRTDMELIEGAAKDTEPLPVRFPPVEVEARLFANQVN